jgi:hypothetical protein
VNGVVNLDGTSAGYADFIHKGDLYLVRFGPTPEQRRNIARVKSRCLPEVFYPSSNSLLIGRCPLTGDDYVVSAFTVTGRRLWRQHWNQRRYFPAIARSQDNSRVAVSTVVRMASPVAAAKTNDNDGEDGARWQEAGGASRFRSRVLQPATNVPRRAGQIYRAES